jgi:hypothetical protein
MPIDGKQEQAFLEDQLAQLVRKVARLQNASSSCTSPLEQQGLQSRMQSTEVQRDLLEAMMAERASGAAMSLDGAILYRLKKLQDQSRRTAHDWRRGGPTPTEYWAIDARRGLLVDLLNRYHDWQYDQGISLGYRFTDRLSRHTFLGASSSISRSASREAYPWYLPANHSPKAGSTREARLEGALRQVVASLDAEGSLDAALLGGSWVLLTGLVTNATSCSQVLRQILKIPGLRGLLSDIRCKRPW